MDNQHRVSDAEITAIAVIMAPFAGGAAAALGQAARHGRA
jgi:hypothetical protein